MVEEEKQRVAELIEASRQEAQHWRFWVQSFETLCKQAGPLKQSDSEYTQRVKAYRKLIHSCAEALSYCLKMNNDCKRHAFVLLNQSLAMMEQGLRMEQAHENEFKNKKTK